MKNRADLVNWQEEEKGPPTTSQRQLHGLNESGATTTLHTVWNNNLPSPTTHRFADETVLNSSMIEIGAAQNTSQVHILDDSMEEGDIMFRPLSLQKR